jgi:hypothetical protein
MVNNRRRFRRKECERGGGDASTRAGKHRLNTVKKFGDAQNEKLDVLYRQEEADKNPMFVVCK